MRPRVYDDPMATDPVGSAVLVHGGWGNPEDWQWVRKLLEDSGVQVVTPDLPSHRSATAGSKEDAEEVRRAIRSCPGPVVAVGWSYGGSIISVAADGEDVRHLVYVADVPVPVEDKDRSLSFIEKDPHIIVLKDGTFVLDNEWWLTEDDGATLPAQVKDHLRLNPRRPVSRSWAHRQEAAAWQTIPTTVILGDTDIFYTPADHQKAAEDFNDFRLIECDHFVIFRKPELVAAAVLEALAPV